MTICRQRSYHGESTSSRPITEVKHRRAWLVLGWVTAWEHHVMLTFPYFFFLFLYLLILHQSTDQTFLSWHISLITNLNNVDDYLDFCQTRHTFYPNIFYLRFDLEKTLHWVPMSCSKVSLVFQMFIVVGPLPEGLQYWADPWRGLSKPSTPRLRPKISLIS